MNQKLRTAGSLLLIAVFGLAATGCGSTPTAAKTYMVRVWRIGQTVDPLKDTIRDFKKAHPTVTVTYFNKKASDNYESSALRSMASKEGPDIWSIPDDWLGDEESVLAQVPEDFFKDKSASCPTTKTASANPACLANMDAAKLLYPAGILKQITSSDGKHLIGIPTSVDALQLYVNTSLLSTAFDEYKAANKNVPSSVSNPIKTLLSAPPATWNDVLSQSKYVTKKNGSTVTRATIAMGTADNVPDSADILQLLMLQNGDPIVGSDRATTVIERTDSTSSGEQVRPGDNALGFYTSFATPSADNYGWNASMPSALDAFGQGKVAMVIAYSDFGAQLKAKYPKVHATVTSVPQESLTDDAVNLIRFSVETVAKNADNASAAFSFMKAYTASNVVGSLASDLKLRSPYLSSLTRQTQTSNSYFDKQVLTGQPVFKRNRSAFDATFRRMITDVAQNDVPVKSAVNAGADTLNALLSGSDSAD